MGWTTRCARASIAAWRSTSRRSASTPTGPRRAPTSARCTRSAARGRRRKLSSALPSPCSAGYTPAYVNFADLYRVEQRDTDGERVLRAGLAAAPDDAALHLALGLLLVRQKRLPEAIDALQRAATLRPDDPHYGYVLGVALHSSGQTERALVALSTAATRHPSDRELLFALTTINRDAGHRDTALEYARRLAAVTPDDPGAMQLVSELSGQH